MVSRFPPPPKVELHVTREKRAEGPGFLSLRRVDLVCEHEDGTKSAEFPYDVLERRAIDAAIMVAHYEENGRAFVYLRSAIRPPIALRRVPPAMSGLLWETPAGLIEPDERPAAAAARELREELGFEVAESDMFPLGPSAFPAPGFIGEAHHYFHVRVDPTTRRDPSGDGSPLEERARIEAFLLADVLVACRHGEVPDAKTELALRRLAEIVPL